MFLCLYIYLKPNEPNHCELLGGDVIYPREALLGEDRFHLFFCEGLQFQLNGGRIVSSMDYIKMIPTKEKIFSFRF